MRIWKWAVAGYLIVPAFLAALAVALIWPSMASISAAAAAWFSVMGATVLIRSSRATHAMLGVSVCMIGINGTALLAAFSGNQDAAWYLCACASGLIASMLAFPLWRRYWWPYYLLRI